MSAMKAINPVSRMLPNRTIEANPNPNHWRWAGQPLTNRMEDTMELSARARQMNESEMLSPAQILRVAKIRAAIAEGTYETSDKFDAAIDRLIDELARD